MLTWLLLAWLMLTWLMLTQDAADLVHRAHEHGQRGPVGEGADAGSTDHRGAGRVPDRHGEAVHAGLVLLSVDRVAKAPDVDERPVQRAGPDQRARRRPSERLRTNGGAAGGTVVCRFDGGVHTSAVPSPEIQ